MAEKRQLEPTPPSGSRRQRVFSGTDGLISIPFGIEHMRTRARTGRLLNGDVDRRKTVETLESFYDRRESVSLQRW